MEEQFALEEQLIEKFPAILHVRRTNWSHRNTRRYPTPLPEDTLNHSRPRSLVPTRWAEARQKLRE